MTDRNGADGLWKALANLQDSPVVARARADAERLRAENRARRTRRQVLAALAGAAGAGGLLVALRPPPALPPGPVPVAYATAVGEVRRVGLPDGSVAVLDTDTTLTVAMEPGRRTVDLQAGRAYFEVSHDAARPFRVVAAYSETVALGTRFSVAALGGPTTVTLMEGRVAVQGGDRLSVILAPGEQVQVGRDGRLGSAHAIEMAHSTAWLSARIDITQQTVADLIAEANRYSHRKIAVADGGVLTERVSGTFKAGDSEAIASALCHRFNLRRVSAENSIILVR